MLILNKGLLLFSSFRQQFGWICLKEQSGGLSISSGRFRCSVKMALETGIRSGDLGFALISEHLTTSFGQVLKSAKLFLKGIHETCSGAALSSSCHSTCRLL